MQISKQQLDEWTAKHPEFEQILALQPVYWRNPNHAPVNELSELPLSMKDIKEAEELWQRFAPFLEKEFPELKESGGIIESPLRRIPAMKRALEQQYDFQLAGDLLLKCDSDLPIAGSVKARGGIYEVLLHAEMLAIEAGLFRPGESTERFASEEFKQFFSGYAIGVGSTGNLGLSIGIMSAKLGFDVSVYMSWDAKAWKKELLREKGARVVEFAGDFSVAIQSGRQETLEKRGAYFVDDEKSSRLFLGYSTAALRLKRQLSEMGITIDQDRPLAVHLPCGVGGAPGGIAFGLKQVFGDAVRCFFVEPTHSPAVLAGLLTGEKSNISVQDLGIDNITEGDGLAVGRPSGFASSFNEKTIRGLYTVEDAELFKLLALLADTEDIAVEPSATAGLIGPVVVSRSSTEEILENTTHIVWATGGALVPKAEWNGFYSRGKQLLETD
ncbi:D-serine ammonia-lyase [Planomicrobium sp. YIM 101495]|uniref:D-serine ammonia-lyase n=1 Tax=Planomicrobium sp. YIM 101495 TaxID=2665160 RepID=UPI0012B6C8CD|nr:D-serine ammonia-lyase [Planomicrobium sp. YIM 101495]MTD30301.1 D-serine ammonia-lyase [Planomicrobium sp. YIM 101495]